MTDDLYGLERFVAAQAGTFDTALAEIARGRKQTHWMWFVFPQIAGLGSSAMARTYAIHSVDEARTYLAHPVLGPRYLRCAEALQRVTGTNDPQAVFGSIDAVKLRSSLTLFHVAGAPPIVREAIDRWFAGQDDPATLERIAAG